MLNLINAAGDRNSYASDRFVPETSIALTVLYKILFCYEILTETLVTPNDSSRSIFSCLL